ncbi:MAG TPA: ribbon-helix-helix domain-containing protein [Thermoplasmata archaeon]|nr:ribbon-helix-helix domain-containing protein [Thermoplasmata archaeon]
MFDKTSQAKPKRTRYDPEETLGPEDERIALRCNRKELQLLDSFVLTGEFRSRSELMRAALREYLRARALPAVQPPVASSPTAATEVAVRLRNDEVETYTAYGELVANGQPLPDVLASLVRRGGLELKATELVSQARAQKHLAEESRAQLNGLRDSAETLARKGVVGR